VTRPSRSTSLEHALTLRAWYSAPVAEFLCASLGTTLAGLNLATRRSDLEQPAHAVFLFGNGPLVAVLREAFTRDEFAGRRQERHRVREEAIGEQVLG
jgi:hypothetical protein